MNPNTEATGTSLCPFLGLAIAAQVPVLCKALNLKGQEHPGHPGGRGRYCPPLEEVLRYNLLNSPLA